MTLWKNAARYALVKAVDPFRGGSVAPQSCLRGCLRSSNRPAWSAYAPRIPQQSISPGTRRDGSSNGCWL